MRSIIKNKRGSYVGFFLLMIVAFIILFVSAIMIYVGNLTQDKLHETMDDMQFGDLNTSETIDATFGEVNESYSHLIWITTMLIFGMVLSIFIGSYKVRTDAVYFVAYILVSIIAIIVSVGIANSYETAIGYEPLADTFATLTGGNYFMLNLPIFITVISFVGGIIMFISWTTREERIYGY